MNSQEPSNHTSFNREKTPTRLTKILPTWALKKSFKLFNTSRNNSLNNLKKNLSNNELTNADINFEFIKHSRRSSNDNQYSKLTNSE